LVNSVISHLTGKAVVEKAAALSGRSVASSACGTAILTILPNA
jgi:hypothetical protein